MPRKNSFGLSRFKSILEDQLEFPAYVKCEHEKNLLTAMLERIPELRLGSGREHAVAIKKHAYFEGFDFDGVVGGTNLLVSHGFMAVNILCLN